LSVLYSWLVDTDLPWIERWGQEAARRGLSLPALAAQAPDAYLARRLRELSDDEAADLERAAAILERLLEEERA